MKKKAVIIMLLVALASILFMWTSNTYAITSEVIDNTTEGKLVEIKEDATNSLEDYKEKYGSDAYGFVAYVLNLIRIYSIPFCFLGIAVSAIYQYVIGIRKMDIQEKGLVLMVTFITILVICQILPLAFAIVVKFGRG